MRTISAHAVGATLCLLVLAGMLVGCGGSMLGGTTTSTTTPLAALAWCGMPAVQFQDEGTNPATLITVWSRVQPVLGFTLALPPQLPSGSCLVLAGGTVHDPIFGGRFSITYRLPDGGALSLAEAPQTAPLPAVTCSASTTNPSSTVMITTCRATRDGVDLTLSATDNEHQIRNWLASLQPNINWVPAKTPTPSP